MNGREFISRVRKLGCKNNIAVSVDRTRGKGSHGTLRYGDRMTIVKVGKRLVVSVEEVAWPRHCVASSQEGPDSAERNPREGGLDDSDYHDQPLRHFADPFPRTPANSS